MIKSLLVGLDGSQASKVAARNAVKAAKLFGAAVRAVFVDDSAIRARMAALPVTPGTPVGATIPPSVLINLEELEEEVAERRAEVAQFYADLCRESGLAGCHLETVRGRSDDSLVRLGHQVDLIIIGRSGLGSMGEEPVIGRTTESVLHHANKPVLVASTREFHGPILVAYDGRHPSNSALASACLWAEASGMELVVLAVKDDEDEAEFVLQEAGNYVSSHNLEAEYVRKAGPVSQTVVDQARELNCGLVAMGAFGDSRLREALVGSQTRRVLVRCEQPVLMNR